MRHASVRLVSSVLVIALFTAGPAGLSARPKRGAEVIVTKLDGNMAKGELVLVKPDSLLVFRGGVTLTIPRDRVHSVSIQRRSRTARAALTGFAYGAMAGILLGLTYNDNSSHASPAVPLGAVAGGLGLIIGVAARRGEKVESVVPLAGLTGPAADERWNALGAYSRVGRRAKVTRSP
jgi:hypothetical protein